MVGFLIDKQFLDGGIPHRVHSWPVVFDTGQVLLGWVAAVEQLGVQHLESRIERAAHWLVSTQDRDGAWRLPVIPGGLANPRSYDVRTAWSLARAGTVLGEAKWCECARRNAHWTANQLSETAWIMGSDADDRQQETPLLHYIVYTARGLAETGLLLKDEALVEAAERVARALLAIYRRRGSLVGRYDQGWAPTVSWRCLVGECQLAVLLSRLAHARDRREYWPIVRSLARGVCETQWLEARDPGIRGGVFGSWPLSGGYAPHSCISWGAKFLTDALLASRYGTQVLG
jgi:hypothetical protein